MILELIDGSPFLLDFCCKTAQLILAVDVVEIVDWKTKENLSNLVC